MHLSLQYKYQTFVLWFPSQLRLFFFIQYMESPKFTTSLPCFCMLLLCAATLNPALVESNVVYSVSFRPERTENLVPACKPVRGTPMFHLGQNFGLFRPEYFFGFLFIYFFSAFSSSASSAAASASASSSSFASAASSALLLLLLLPPNSLSVSVPLVDCPKNCCNFTACNEKPKQSTFICMVN